MRIIISSALPLSKSGYGNQTLYMVYGLLQQNIEVPALICWNVNSTDIMKDVTKPHKFKNILNIFFPNNENNAILKLREYIPDISDEHIQKFGEINIYPVLSENWTQGNYKIADAFLFNLISMKENSKLMIFHQDVFYYQHLKNKFDFKSFIFAPLHFYPLDQPNKEGLKNFDILIGMSDFGCKLLKDNFPNKPVHKIPLCVDTNLSNLDHDKKYYKNLLGFSENNFVCTMIANNEDRVTDRKAFYQNLRAFSKLQKKYKNCRLYIHSRMDHQIDLLKLLKIFKVRSYKFCDQKKFNSHLYSRKDIFNILKGSVVLLCASKSEGFGIPILEVQSCGCSVITTNFSAMPELTVNGITTEYKDTEPYPDDKNCYWAIPDINNIFKALETIYNWSPSYRNEMKKKGIEFSKNFSHNIIAKKIIDLCKDI